MKKGKKTKLNLGSFLTAFLAGGFIGGTVAGFALHYVEEKGNYKLSLVYVAMAFVFLILSFFLQIIFHEAGHGLFGRKSGFRFVSFRVGSFMWIRKDGKIKTSRFSIAGTGGQCLMMPPETDLFRCPYKWYNIGGVLMNILVTLLFVFLLTGGILNGYVKLFAVTMIVSGIIVLITNGIPMKISGITNDGYNMILLSRDALSRYAFGLQLKVYGLQMQGKRLKEMPEEWFVLPSEPDFTNIFHVSLFLLKAMRYTEHLDFESAQALLLQMEPYENKLIPLYRNEWKCELLFCEMIRGGNSNKIEELFSPDFEKYCRKTSKYMLNKSRVLYAHAVLVEKNEEKAEGLRKSFFSIASRYHNQGEASAEVEIMQEVKRRLAL